jgi:hypothetical protein
LTWRERRALRAIDRYLTEQDPSLAARLHGPTAPGVPARLFARLGWSLLGLSIVLGVSGMMLGVTALQMSAGLVLLSFPPLVLLLAAVFRCKLSDLGRAEWRPTAEVSRR